MGTEEISTQDKSNIRNTQPMSRWLHITYIVSLVLLVIGIVLVVSPALINDNYSFANAVQPSFLWATILSVAMNVFLLIFALLNKIPANKRAALLSLFSLLLFQLTYFIFVAVYFSSCCVTE